MTQDTGAQIMDKAKSLGASLAGIASVDLIKKSPSYEMHEKNIKGTKIQGISDSPHTYPKEIKWPANAKSALVIALSHPKDKLELDWYLESGNTPGNHTLMEINRELSPWIEEKFGINTHHVPYGIAQGGMYLKDSAVLSGLGCIGKNNLIVTPEFGPRVRFRAMLLDDELTPTGPIDFNPCEGCEEFCRKVCTLHVFDETVISPEETEMSDLPGRNGSYSRVKCRVQSSIDAHIYDGEVQGRKLEGTYQTQKYAMFCVRCILACPVGA